MAFAMTTLRRLKSGAFSARKSIPKDVRAEYRERFGGGWEERFHADVGTPLGEAKRTLNEWPSNFTWPDCGGEMSFAVSMVTRLWRRPRMQLWPLSVRMVQSTASDFS